MPGRQYGTMGRYGFNGKEQDPEVKNKSGTQYDYGMRIYDSRIGKFLSVDPLGAKFPFYTPYQFAGNRPVWAVDLDGLEPLETSTVENPKELSEVMVSSSPKRQKALNFITDNDPVNMFYTFNRYVSGNTFANQLRNRILHPYELDQGKESGPGGGTYFCWIAAACSYQYQENPEKMASTVLDLYSKGKAKIGNLQIQINDEVRKAIGSNTFDNDGGLAGQLADQLLFMSIAASYKGYLNLANSSYNRGDENTIWAGGTFNKFDGLMKAFGSNVVVSKGYDAMRTNVLGKSCNVLLDAQAAGQKIFLFIYSAHFKHPPPEHNDPNYIGGSTIGSHFVQVRNVTQFGSYLKMDFWDYGGWTPGHIISIEALNKCTFGILTTKD